MKVNTTTPHPKGTCGRRRVQKPRAKKNGDKCDRNPSRDRARCIPPEERRNETEKEMTGPAESPMSQAFAKFRGVREAHRSTSSIPPGKKEVTKRVFMNTRGQMEPAPSERGVNLFGGGVFLA